MPPQSIEEMVERQVLLWQEQGRLGLQYAPREGHTQAPVIAISRQHGALGARLGRLVAERLDFAYYDRELVERIASEAQVRQAVVDSVDERARHRIADWLADHVGGGRLSDSEYVRHLSHVLLSIAYHGRAVIVGRGACFLLDPTWTLRVRAFAPLEVRVARVAQSHKLALDEARTDVESMDAGRTDFNRRHFGRDVNDPAGYDLVIDTGTLPLPACVDLVLTAFKARFGAGGVRHRNGHP